MKISRVIQSTSLNRNSTLAALLACLVIFSCQAMAGRSIPLSVINMDGIHAADDGIIYAAEGFNGSRVFGITQEGITFVLAGGLAGPIDVANDSSGNLYVTNFNDATVTKISPDGSSVEKFADVLPGPAGIVVDANDNVYVSHYGEGNGDGDTVLKITPDGMVSVFAEGDFLFAPVATAIDEHGNIYVANFNQGAVIKISPEGSQELLATVDAPNGFAIGHMAYANGRLYASGAAAQTIYVIRMSGKVRERSRRVDETRFPNGLTYNEVDNSILFTYGFGRVSDIEKIKLRPVVQLQQ
jgi:DNA-binding beta-propeller fold protein YncE